MSIFTAIGGALKKVFGVVAPAIIVAANIGGGIVGTFNPALGTLIGKVSSLIQHAEDMYEAAKQGAAKKQTVMQIALSELPLAETFIAQFGVNAKLPNDEIAKLVDLGAAFYTQAGVVINKTHELNAPPTPAA